MDGDGVGTVVGEGVGGNVLEHEISHASSIEYFSPVILDM